jgi:hypothetical protein
MPHARRRFNYPSPYYALRVISSKYNLKYIEFPSGMELYDFDGAVSGHADPYETTNVYHLADVHLKLLLATTLEGLKVCKGNGGTGGAQPGPVAVSCLVAGVPAFTAPSSPPKPPAVPPPSPKPPTPKPPTPKPPTPKPPMPKPHSG